MDLETTRPGTSHRSELQVADYEEEEEEVENVLSEPKWIEGVFGACSTNNNRLPDGLDQDPLDVLDQGANDAESNYDENDVEITSSKPPKSPRIGKRKCAECDEMVSISNMSRHNKQYHSPGGKNYKSAKFTRRQTGPARIKCEFCGKGLAESSLANHIRVVHKGKQCRWCGLEFSFKHCLVDHEMICSKK